MKANSLILFVSIILLVCPSLTAAPPKDGVYIAVEGDLMFVLTLDKRDWFNTAIALYQLKDGEWSLYQSRGLQRPGGDIATNATISGFGNTFIVESASGPGYDKQNITQTEQSFSPLLDGKSPKVHRRFSRIAILNKDF